MKVSQNLVFTQVEVQGVDLYGFTIDHTHQSRDAPTADSATVVDTLAKEGMLEGTREH